MELHLVRVLVVALVQALVDLVQVLDALGFMLIWYMLLLPVPGSYSSGRVYMDGKEAGCSGARIGWSCLMGV